MHRLIHTDETTTHYLSDWCHLTFHFLGTDPIAVGLTAVSDAVNAPALINHLGDNLHFRFIDIKSTTIRSLNVTKTLCEIL